MEILSILKMIKKKAKEKKEEIEEKVEAIIRKTIPRPLLEKKTKEALERMKRIIVKEPILEVRRGIIIRRPAFLIDIHGRGEIFDTFLRTKETDFAITVIVDEKRAWDFSSINEAIAVSPSDLKLKAYEVYRIGGYLFGVENISFKKRFAILINPKNPLYIYEFKCIGWREYERAERE